MGGKPLSGSPTIQDILSRLFALEHQPAPQADKLAFTRVAGLAIGGHRTARIGNDGKVYVGDGQRTAGITIGAANADQPVTVQTSGEMVEPTWSWAAGAVWQGAGGVLTQILPTSGPLVEIGIAIAPNAIIINPRLVAQL